MAKPSVLHPDQDLISRRPTGGITARERAPAPTASSRKMERMADPLALIDAFTATLFKGNPAAVCLLRQAREAAWMQAMAIELNQPATAFLQPREESNHYDLRWFTAKRELDLCGHGTLAATHFLAEEGLLQVGQTASFHTRGGHLSATHDGEWVELNFPSRPVVETETPAGLQVAIGENEILFAGQNGLDLLIELATEDAVRELTPNLERLASIDMRGLIVTARGNSPYDCVSRFFAPRMGIPEDQVTGSAHCALAPYWAAKLGKHRLLAYQASARGGVLRLEHFADRIRIGGQATTVWRGSLV